MPRYYKGEEIVRTIFGDVAVNDEPCNPFDHPIAELLQNEEWRKTVLRSHTPGVFCYVNPKAENWRSMM